MLKVAARLLQDGHQARAGAVLTELARKLRAPKPPKGFDLARYHTLRGLVALKLGDAKLAVRELEAALSAGQKDENARLLLAQARFALRDYAGTLAALSRCDALARRYAGIHLLRAQSHWRGGHKTKAWQALSAGLRFFPAARALLRQRVLLMIDLGLFRQATQAGLRLLQGRETKVDEQVAIAEALRRGKQHRRAILILEQALLRRPGELRLLRQLARSYLDDGKPRTAAGLMARAAEKEPALRVEAAELYRRAGQLAAALYQNSRVAAQPAKLRQRLGLLVELERFEEAAALAPRLSRLGLLKDQRIVYALAYACYKTRRYGEAERWLRRISEAKLFAQAVTLRRAMQACRARGYACVD